MRVPPDFGVDDGDLIEVVILSDLRAAREPEECIMREMARQGYDADTSFGVKLALEEAMTNAIKHGNCNDPSRHIVIRYYVDGERAVMMVGDEGGGFCPESVPDPTEEKNLERPDGRGIMLMQSYMTKVRFNQAGNEVWLLKERQP